MSRPSYEVTKRYRDKAIARIIVDAPKELVSAWEEQLKRDKLTKAGFIKQAINAYLAEKACTTKTSE